MGRVLKASGELHKDETWHLSTLRPYPEDWYITEAN